jgi:hypothetical protein
VFRTVATISATLLALSSALGCVTDPPKGVAAQALTPSQVRPAVSQPQPQQAVGQGGVSVVYSYRLANGTIYVDVNLDGPQALRALLAASPGWFVVGGPYVVTGPAAAPPPYHQPVWLGPFPKEMTRPR